MHDPLIEFATVPPIPLHPAVLAAGSRLAGAVADLLAVADDVARATPWRWRPTDPEDVELRYGCTRIHERLEAAIGAIEVGRARRQRIRSGRRCQPWPPWPRRAGSSTARWRRSARTTGTPTRAAANGRSAQTFGHIVAASDRTAGTTPGTSRKGVVGVETVRPSEDDFPPEPTEEEEAAGTAGDRPGAA